MKTVIVTGATSGIGYAVCQALLRQRCRVIGVGRSEESASAARERLLDEFPGADIAFRWGDLMQLSEVNAWRPSCGGTWNA